MSTRTCPVHLTKFTSASHKPVILDTCPHEHCEEAMQRELDESGTYKCPICLHQEFEESISINQIATTRLLALLEEKELACDRHPHAIGEFLCTTDQKVYCEECHHAGDCCKDAGDCLDFEVRMLVESERKAGRVPSQFEHEVKNIGKMTLKTQYALLRRIAAEKNEKMCAAHRQSRAEGIHQTTLKLGCNKCVSVDYDKYIAIDPLQRQELVGRVQTFLRGVHCYSLDLPTLRSLRLLSEMSWDDLLQLVISLSEISAPGSQSPPKELLCPQCYSPCKSLTKLNCFKVNHGICAGCKESMHPVTCPLDGNQFFSSNGDLIVASPVPPEAISPPEVAPAPREEESAEEYGPFATPKARAIPHWRGTKLPPPTLRNPEFKVLNRFFGVYPPIGVPECEVQDSMSPWNVDQRINQVEAVTFLVGSPITLTGMTIACPVSATVRMTVEQVQVLKGDSLASPLHVSPMSEAVEVSGGAVAADILFNRPAVLDQYEKYTLSLRLRAPGHGVLQVYKGNQITAREFLVSEGVDLWMFEEPKAADKVMNGENSKSGPILRLFYI